MSELGLPRLSSTPPSALERFQRAAKALPSRTPDFWPAQDLQSWQDDPQGAFVSWLAQQRILDRPLRESSRITYAGMFSTWVRHLESSLMGMLDASTVEAASFFKEHAYEPISHRRYLQLLDKVYRHLIQVGWGRHNPFMAELKKQEELVRVLPPGLTDGDVAALLTVLEGLSGWKGARDRAMAALLLGAGLRSNELMGLDLSHLRPSYRVLLQPTGVHREHTTLVLHDGPWRGYLLAWLERRAEIGIPGSYFAPSTASGKQYAPSGLFRRIRSWFEAAEIKTEQQGAHILRNTFAREALSGGRYTPEEVQEFLGHEDLSATLRLAGTQSDAQNELTLDL